MNIFKSTKNKQWNKNHTLYWKESLELNDSGFTVFQNKLFVVLEILLKEKAITYTTEITRHEELDPRSRIVKMILITIDEHSKFWIYHDMADFIILNKHQVYERWDYLQPDDLIHEYIKSAKEVLKTDQN